MCCFRRQAFQHQRTTSKCSLGSQVQRKWATSSVALSLILYKKDVNYMIFVFFQSWWRIDLSHINHFNFPAPFQASLSLFAMIYQVIFLILHIVNVQLVLLVISCITNTHNIQRNKTREEKTHTKEPAYKKKTAFFFFGQIWLFKCHIWHLFVAFLPCASTRGSYQRGRGSKESTGSQSSKLRWDDTRVNFPMTFPVWQLELVLTSVLQLMPDASDYYHTGIFSFLNHFRCML